jgi:cation diffusion facilitator family transporter
MHESVPKPFFARATTVPVVGVFVYILVAFTKITVGMMVASPMLIGDGWHNVGDVLNEFAIMGVQWLSKRPRTKDYPYGRQNIEFFASLVIGGGLFYTALTFALTSVAGLLSYAPAADQAVRWFVSAISFGMLSLPVHVPLIMNVAVLPYVLLATGGCLLPISCLSAYQAHIGAREHDAALVADSKETASDARISLVALVGVIGEYAFQLPIIEYVLGLGVAYLISCTGRELFSEAWGILLQRSIGDEHEEALRKAIERIAGVDSIAELKTFRVGHTAIVHVTIVTSVSADAFEGIKETVSHHARKQLGEEYIDCDLRIKNQLPERDWHRTAYLVVCRDDKPLVVAGSFEHADHVLVCDMEGGELDKWTVEPLVRPDLAELLVCKHVRTLYQFLPDESLSAELAKHGIALNVTCDYDLRALGVIA